MKKLFVLVNLFYSFNVHADVVYSSYESYYKSLPDRMFDRAGKKISVIGQVVQFDEKRISLSDATAFPDEPIFEGELGNIPLLFESSTHYCVEGQSATANGTAARHRAVYLIYRNL